MLTFLHVKNFALINELDIEFGAGMSVLTGETGAGKSILIGAMNAISGNKLDRGIIRRGQDYALVEMQFDLREDFCESLAHNYGIPFEGESSVILSRKYNTSGRSIYRANGVAVTASVMGEIFNQAIDIHSQHEHQSLLSPRAHIKLLDQYLGDELAAIKKKLKDRYTLYKDYRNQLKEGHLNDEHRIREMDFLKFEINEIESANLSVGEDVALQKEYKILSNSRKIQEAMGQITNLLKNGRDANADTLFAHVSGEFEAIRHLDKGLNDLATEFEQLTFMLDDFGRNLLAYQDDLNGDEDNLEKITQRIHSLNSLKQKYGDTIETILASLDEKKTSLSELENYDANIEAIRRDLEAREKEIYSLCSQLTNKRKKAAKKIAKDITTVLADLNFNNNQVEVEVAPLQEFTAEGMDKVTILISTNKNEPVQPLGKIASGGELSRVMLALKSVFAKLEQVNTLVFDEIDTGISGRTAQKVSEKMAYLASERQLIVITHLPQIAAMADCHYLISKEEQGAQVETRIDPLTEEAVHEELSRLIGGATITEATRQAAKEMKEQATALKEK